MPEIQTKTVEPVSPKVDFADAEGEAIVRYARDIVDSTIRGDGAISPLDPELANAPGFGAFVTLKRGARLRAW